MLSVLRTNHFGDTTYVVDKHGTVSISDLDDEAVWVIESPTLNIAAQFPTNQLQVYGGVPFIASKKALKCIPQTARGAACAVSCYFNGTAWFLFVLDDKPFAHNVCGVALPDESPQQCMIRMLQAELAITCTPSELMPIGHWTFTNTNTLINYTAHTTTHAFHVHVAYDRVRHLLLRERSSCGANTLRRSVNGDTFTVKAIPTARFFESPPMTALDDKTFIGHHHDLVRRILKLPPMVDISYLPELTFTCADPADAHKGPCANEVQDLERKVQDLDRKVQDLERYNKARMKELEHMAQRLERKMQELKRDNGAGSDHETGSEHKTGPDETGTIACTCTPLRQE